ncbi:MAG: NAD(P)H-dependent oxidoreductase subunit E, partial [Planctomycetota bacterium]
MIRHENPTHRYVEEIVERIGRTPDAVIPLLHEIQDHYRYLPPDALQHLSAITDITPAAIQGVSTFYDCFRHKPAGEHSIKICHGTACHVKGSPLVEDAIRRELNIPEGDDTDPDRRFTVERVACVGCCSLAPVVSIEEETYGCVTSQSTPGVISGFNALQEMEAGNGQSDIRYINEIKNPIGDVTVSMDSCCMVSRPEKVLEELRHAAHQLALPVRVRQVGCKGLCRYGPSLSITDDKGSDVAYAGVQPDQAAELLIGHFKPPRLLDRIGQTTARLLDRFVDGLDESPTEKCRTEALDPGLAEAERHQVRIASEHYGKLDPLDLDEFIAHQGFEAWKKCLSEDRPQQVIDDILKSGLRGRGGGGFP